MFPLHIYIYIYIRNKFSATVLRQLQMALRQLKQTRIARIRCRKTLRLKRLGIESECDTQGQSPHTNPG